MFASTFLYEIYVKRLYELFGIWKRRYNTDWPMKVAKIKIKIYEQKLK